MVRSKIIRVALAACLLACATACAQAESFRVTATFYPLYVAVLNVARDVEGIRIDCMAPAQAGCLHDYQMTTADRRALEDSDVIIVNGAGLEPFLVALLPGLDAETIDASVGIPLLADGHEPGHEENPHVWVSIAGMMAQVRNIAAGLAQADPAHATQYAQNAERYLERLEVLREEMAEALAPFAGTPIVTFHEAFDYFARDFGLRVAAVVRTDPGSAPSARALAEVAEIIRREGVKALFTEPGADDASARVLSRETGVPVYVLDPAVSMGANPMDCDAYLIIMRENTRTLVEALS